ncbi:GNAT family N-acetyltransferase [Legionella pneumophila]|uniref:GNAT family N-acetyltransferase n=1 Tax=Legionella pneumophila TaxID=446 RepID=UPI003A4C53DB
MTYQLSLENNPNQEDIQVLGNAIMKQATQKKGFNPLDFFAFFIRDADNTIVGGCNGSALYGCLYIDQLWVSDLLRKQGWGAALIEAALQYGKENGCTFATVNTFDWEALGFYQKKGFKIEFERHGFLKDSVFYFLRKNF